MQFITDFEDAIDDLFPTNLPCKRCGHRCKYECPCQHGLCFECGCDTRPYKQK